MKYTRNDKSNTEIEFEVSIPADDFIKEYEKALKELSKDVRAKGFRPGKAPEDVVQAQKGPEARQKAVEELLPKNALEIMKKEDVYPVLPPKYDITAYEEGKELKFKMTITIIPDITLPDLKKIKVQKESAEVKDKEIDDIIKRIWQEKRGKHKDKSDKWVAEVAPSLGFQSKTLADLTKEVKEAVKIEKRRLVEQKYSTDVLAEAIKLAKIEIPEEMVKYEADERERSFHTQLEQLKLSADDFCKARNVTMDQLKEEWVKDSREAIENDVFLATYARERKLKISEKDLEAEVELMKKQSKNPNDKMFDNPEWRGYIQRVMLKRMAYSAFLEEVKPGAATGDSAKVDKKNKSDGKK